MTETEYIFKSYELLMLVGSVIGGGVTVLILFYSLVMEPQLKVLDKKILALEVRTDEQGKDIKVLEKSTIKFEENFKAVMSAISDLKKSFEKFVEDEKEKDKERAREERERLRDQKDH
jgi:hypothetical protein